MAWPTSPTNGDTTTVNGILYVYNSTSGSWSPTASSATDFNVGNITATGNLSSSNYSDAGNLTVGGNLTVTGTTTTNGNLAISGNNFRMAARSAFRVYGSGSTNWSTSSPTGGQMTSSQFTVDYNQGSNLAPATGIYTAPVAGLYSVHLNARIGPNTAMSQICVIKNPSGSDTILLMWESAASGTANHFGVSTIVNLAANDTLVLKITAGSLQFDANDSWAVAYIG